jgi:fermentation-respiration switch protein FrsA (DUF1100 family)
VAGVVLLGGAASNLEEILTAQLSRVLEAHGATPQEVDEAALRQRGFLRAVRGGRDRDARRIGLGDSSSRWFRSHFEADPAAEARALRVPALALLFEHDLQVPAGEAPLLREVFGGSESPRAVVEVVPGLDHVLRRVGWRPGLGAYADTDRLVDQGVLDLVADFARSLPCAARLSAEPPSE